MERVIILKNTDTGQALTLPVTPKSYPAAAGRAVERLDMAQTGQIALPGLRTLFAGTLEFMLPARAYPFLTAGAVTQPSHYIGLLTAWSAAANVCRYIVTGTDVNCRLPLYEYRYLEEAKVETVTQNSGRSVDPDSQPETANSYTVVKGDCLWTICKKFYGDGSLAYKLATANGIKNPNLIYPGQVLTLADKETLTGYAATPAPAAPKTAASTSAQTQAEDRAALDRELSPEAARQEQLAMRTAQAEARAAIGLGLSTNAARQEQLALKQR